MDSVGVCTLIPAGLGPDDECTSCQACNGSGTRVANAQGTPCDSPSDCLSSFCSDVVCCDDACSEVTEACNLPGEVDLCSPLPSPVPKLRRPLLALDDLMLDTGIPFAPRNRGRRGLASLELR